AVRDDPLGVDASFTDVFEQVRHVPADVALVHPQRDALVHRRADVHQVPGRAVDADDRHVAALADGLDGPVDGHGDAGLHEAYSEHAVQLAAFRFHSDRVDGDVGSENVVLVVQVD